MDSSEEFSDNQSDSGVSEVEDESPDETAALSQKKRKLTESDSDLQLQKKVKKDKSLYKQPTAEELNQLRDIENLHHSNSFRLKIEELLSEINIKKAKVAQFNAWFKDFEKTVSKISEYGEISTSEFVQSKKAKDDRQKFINAMYQYTEHYLKCDGENTKSWFVKPNEIFPFGSCKTEYSTRYDYSPNICVTMPKKCFYSKDFTNNRYLVKRLHYLLYLQHEIQNNAIIKDLKIVYKQGNTFLPLLQITPKYSDKIKINLYIVPEKDTFRTTRFEPSLNNIKNNIYSALNKKNCLNLFKDVKVDKYVTVGTPVYNTLLLHDFTLEENNKYLEIVLQNYKCAKDGIKLLTIWLTQRKLNQQYTDFTNQLLAYTIAYLIAKKKISNTMSSYQVIKIFWIFMNESDWRKTGITLNTDKANVIKDYHSVFDVVFLDQSGSFNIAGFLNVGMYARVKHECGIALTSLNRDVINSFETLFMTKMPYVVQFDAIIYFTDKNCFENIYKNFTEDSDKWVYFGFYRLLIIKQITTNLLRGLTNRVEYLVPINIGNFMESSICKPVDKIAFGIKLNPEFAFKVLEVGPQQFELAAKEFKEFWGELASLRRFTDSSIHEAVYFENTKTIQDRRAVFSTIIDFVAEKLNTSCEIVCNQMENVLNLEHIELPFENGTNEEATKKVLTVSEELFRKIRDLKLTNSIYAIQGVSPVFCGSDPCPPIATNYRWDSTVTFSNENNILLQTGNQAKIVPRFTPIIECVMQLNLNTKAPNDLAPFRAFLASTYLEIAEQISDDSIKCSLAFDHVDVLYRGLVFRLKAFHAREIQLLKRCQTAAGLLTYRNNVQSVTVETSLDVLPKVYGALNGMQKQYASFGTSTALIKRWIRSQLLHESMISDVVINLLNASLFLSPEPYDRATLPQLAFVRFLQFLAEYNFKQRPVVVNFNDELKNEKIYEYENQLLEKRSEFNALHILMPYDDGKSLFTTTSPNELILRRLSKLARDSYKYMMTCIEEQTLIDNKVLFVPNLQGYDAIIHLNPSLNSKGHYALELKNTVKIKEYKDNKLAKFPVANFNPVDVYLKELLDNYGQYAYFFYDEFGGKFISMIWKKDVLDKLDFKISNIPGRKLINEKLVIDTKAFIEHFAVLGSGLVKNIESVS